MAHRVAAFFLFREEKMKNTTRKDFYVTFKEPRIINFQGYNVQRHLLEIGTFEFFVGFEAQNRRASLTSVKFEIARIDTDLPLAERSNQYKMQIQPQGKQVEGNLLRLDPNDWLTGQNLRVTLHIPLQPYQELLPQIREAKRFRVVLHLTQADKEHDVYEETLDIPNIAEQIEKQIAKQIENWLSNGELIEHLRLLWKR